MRRAIIITISVIGAGAVLLLGLAIWLGYVTVGIKDPSQKVVVQTNVCDDGVVTRYNEAAKSDSIDTYRSKLKVVFDDVVSREGHAEDPTCAFIVYRYHLTQNKAEDVNAAVSTLKRLSDDGRYPSNKLTDIQSIEHVDGRSSIVDGNIQSNSAGGAG